MAPDLSATPASRDVSRHIRARCPHRRFWIMPKFSLAALTVLELAPPELVEVAAACGYDHVGVRLLPAVAGGLAYPLMDDEAGLKETLARLDATGITVADLEVVAFRPETEIAAFSAFLRDRRAARRQEYPGRRL